MGFKLAAEAIVAVCVGSLVYLFVDAYRMQQTDSQSNLYIAAVPLALGLLGWKKTTIAGFLFLGLGMLVAFAGFVFAGPLGLLLGAAPGAAGVCFLVSAAFDWRRRRTFARERGGESRLGQCSGVSPEPTAGLMSKMIGRPAAGRRTPKTPRP